MRIIKVPSSQGSMGKNTGCEKAPDRILEAMKNLPLDEEGRECRFSGDEVQIPEKNLTQTNQRILEKLTQLEEPGILLGGDHSITYPGVRAFAKSHQDAGVVIFDAHPDCINNFKPPSHEDYLKVLLENGVLSKQNVVLVGIRKWDVKEFAYLRKNNIKYYSMKEIFEEGIRETCDNVMSVARQWGALYLSIDIDVIDPGFAPGTGYPSPGGLTSRQLIYFLHRIKKLNNLKMADLVEVNPQLDPFSQITVKLGAKLLRELW